MTLNFDINDDLMNFLKDVNDFEIDNKLDLQLTREELYVLMKSSIFASNCLSSYLKQNFIDITNGSKLDRFFDLLGDSIMAISCVLDR